jgi:hypothetical protein
MINIDITDEDFGTIVNCAVRYALGRRTYIVSTVSDFITPLFPYLSSKTLWNIQKDIKGAYSLGDDDIDKPVWIRMLYNVQAELDKRENI